MKLIILGANGRTGTHVVRFALDQGAHVTAVVRSPAKVPAVQSDRLKIAIGNPCDTGFLTPLLRGQDALISTLGGRRPTGKATDVYHLSAASIVDAAWNSGLKRVVVTSTALLFPPANWRDRLVAALVPNVVQSANRMERILCAADLDVTVARCGWLNDGAETEYRASPAALPEGGTSISRKGLARFLVDAALSDGSGPKIFGVAGPNRLGRVPEGARTA